MLQDRRRVCQGIAGLALAAALPAAAQTENYPSKPIRLVVPYPPGGFTDIAGRLIAEKLSARFDHPVFVENKGGGAGTIGTNLVVKSPADGHTLLLVANDLSINETLMEGRIGYKARVDLTPVIQVAWSPIVLVVHPAFPPKTFAELIETAKARPGKVSFGSGGTGTGGHLALEMLKARAGVDLVHVPYRGNGPAINDLLGGQVQGMFIQYAVARPHITAGTLRVIATPSVKRLAVLPDVPTIAEAGLPGFKVEPWFGITAPAHTPKAIVLKLNAEIGQVMRQADVVRRMAELGAEAMSTSPDAFAQLIDREIVEWGETIRKAGIKSE